MLAVVDFNIVFSALVRKGNCQSVFEDNKAMTTFEFVALDFLFSELGKRIGKLLLQSKFTKKEFSRVFSFIRGEISIVPILEYADKLEEAKELNPKDAPYLALALKLGCPIISGDKGLKEQSKVKVLSPQEALSIIYALELPGPALSEK